MSFGITINPDLSSAPTRVSDPVLAAAADAAGPVTNEPIFRRTNEHLPPISEAQFLPLLEELP